MTKTISNTQKNLNKEESIMTKRGLALIDKETNQVVETTLDELDYETIVNLKELTKDVLRIMLEEENVFMSNNKFNRTKRIDLINMLYNLMHPSVETDTEAEASNVTDGNELTDNNKEESTMTTEMMMKELLDNGYGFSRPLSDEEIKAEYEQMLEDFEAIDKYNSGASILKVLDSTNKSNPEEENTMNQNSTVPVGDLEITNDNAPENVEELNNNKEEESIMYQVVCTDHAYYNEESVPFTGTKEQCEEYVKQHFTATDAELGLASYEVIPASDTHVCKENTTTNNKEEDTTMPENKPVVIKDIAMDLLKRIILQADKNDAHNFISHWMVTSFIAEAITGKPLKGKDENNKWVEFSFTDEEKKAIADAREEFVKLAKFTTIRNKKNEIAGYVIPVKSLVYGRHLWLGRACVYHFKDIKGTVHVYHVSLNGIKNTATNNVTPLDDKAYALLESKCKFIC